MPYEDWKDTYATHHMWSQIVGKIAVALAPPINHCWAVSLHVTARDLATRTLPHGAGTDPELDFGVVIPTKRWRGGRRAVGVSRDRQSTHPAASWSRTTAMARDDRIR